MYSCSDSIARCCKNFNVILMPFNHYHCDLKQYFGGLHVTGCSSEIAIGRCIQNINVNVLNMSIKASTQIKMKSLICIPPFYANISTHYEELGVGINTDNTHLRSLWNLLLAAAGIRSPHSTFVNLEYSSEC